MYSLVLAAVLTTGTATPAWCHGGYGGYCGYSCYSCGGCYGCYGCWGCYGCYGGGWGWGYDVSYPYYWNCGGCYGCYGGWYSSYGSYSYPYYAAAQPAVVPVAVADRGADASPAKIAVHLPADAKLYVNGKLANLTSENRSFSTPSIAAGRDYSYTLRAEAVRDGKTVSESKTAVFRAGGVARVDFGTLGTVSAVTVTENPAAPARVTVRLPADATLYVDNKLCPLTSETRSFDTPKLEPGRAYYYNLRTESKRDGRSQSETRRVVVEAGKRVTVDFNEQTVLTSAQR